MTIDKVKKLIAEQLNVDENKIQEDSKLIEDLGADSLDVVEMLMTLEDEFGIAIPDDEFGLSISDEEAVTLKTIKDIVDYIEQH